MVTARTIIAPANRLLISVLQGGLAAARRHHLRRVLPSPAAPSAEVPPSRALSEYRRVRVEKREKCAERTPVTVIRNGRTILWDCATVLTRGDCFQKRDDHSLGCGHDRCQAAERRTLSTCATALCPQRLCKIGNDSPHARAAAVLPQSAAQAAVCVPAAAPILAARPDWCARPRSLARTNRALCHGCGRIRAGRGGRTWCRWRDSNSHGGSPRRILNPLRLPFRHTGGTAPGLALRLACVNRRACRTRA